MTTSELNIGDWVTDENGMRMYVQAIYDVDTVYLDFDGNEADTWEEDIEDIHPIPLTDAILKEIGFKFFKGGKEYTNYRLNSKDYIIHIENNGKRYELHMIKKNTTNAFHNQIQITYLHELQNAFRLITGKEIYANDIQAKETTGQTD